MPFAIDLRRSQRDHVVVVDEVFREQLVPLLQFVTEWQEAQRPVSGELHDRRWCQGPDRLVHDPRPTGLGHVTLQHLVVTMQRGPSHLGVHPQRVGQTGDQPPLHEVGSPRVLPRHQGTLAGIDATLFHQVVTGHLSGEFLGLGIRLQTFSTDNLERMQHVAPGWQYL